MRGCYPITTLAVVVLIDYDTRVSKISSCITASKLGGQARQENYLGSCRRGEVTCHCGSQALCHAHQVGRIRQGCDARLGHRSLTPTDGL